MIKNEIRSVKNLTLEQLNDWIEEKKYPKFRGSQVFRWIHKKNVNSPDEMINIPKKLRNQIKNYGKFNLVKLQNADEKNEKLINNDNKNVNFSKKYLFKLLDGNFIESVLIVENGRKTICLSSQVGCGLGCKFCQTAKMGFVRNLTVGEIVDQLLFISKNISEPITNVVYMGMGVVEKFAKDIVKGSPVLGPILYFALTNGLTYGYYLALSNNMHWPFESEVPMLNNMGKIGISISF